MERILVGMDSRHGSWEAWARAISLARRIEARVYALLVLTPVGKADGTVEKSADESVRRRLELQIELAKSDGIAVDYFVSEGDYEEEVIQFAANNRITLMVAEPPERDDRRLDREFASFQKIRHRIRCKMELVSTRRTRELQS